ncbi:unnamed protein product [Plutella xylostella]|uniref:(diamondback moth) hypothetical protein n=1 Tax=Plutella xylostella TaxID=51655 RepID=A0A8S4DL61_PLUXY|nr:unnamed protein product [Plutella xylostella]
MYLRKDKAYNCRHCFKPPVRRLALLQTTDDYECYAESYVKCFWGMCHQHKSVEAFTLENDKRIITMQPRKQRLYSDLPHSK